jgi:hypothetical protein
VPVFTQTFSPSKIKHEEQSTIPTKETFMLIVFEIKAMGVKLQFIYSGALQPIYNIGRKKLRD